MKNGQHALFAGNYARWCLAIQMQNRFSKEHVLELYLNQVYFGNLAYGIEAAAQTYFHKSAQELSTAECALLAGIIQNPVFP